MSGNGISGIIEVKMDRRRNVAALLRLKIGPGGKAGHVGDDKGRETLDGGIVVLGRLVEKIAGRGDAVLGALQLRLEIEEVLVGLQVRITFHNDQQAGKR